MKGNIIYEHKKSDQVVLDKNITYIINDLLTTSYDYNMIDYNSPSCINIAPKITTKWAIKSGTTDYDSLTVGYNKNLLVGVWIGYDNNQKLEKGEAKYSKLIWVDTAEPYNAGNKEAWYKMPENVVGVLVNPIDGNVANEKSNKKRILYYLKGSQPLAK
jgi:membrane carboxypeptidase/penicillin-binding protein